MLLAGQSRAVDVGCQKNEFKILSQLEFDEYIPDIWFLRKVSFTSTATSLEILDDDPDADCER